MKELMNHLESFTKDAPETLLSLGDITIDEIKKDMEVQEWVWNLIDDQMEYVRSILFNLIIKEFKAQSNPDKEGE